MTIETGGIRIRQARVVRGWTQKDLANKLGLTAQNISDYERGKAKPPSNVIIGLAKIFDKPEGWLYESLTDILRKHKEQTQEEEIVHLEEVNTKHEAFPWAYYFRSQFILWKWAEHLKSEGSCLRLKYAIRSKQGYIFTIGPDTERHINNIVYDSQDLNIVIGKDNDVSFLQNCLYMCPSPFKHYLLGEIFREILPTKRVKTNFLISEKEDFYFGYKTNTVEIRFNGNTYTPKYSSKGHGKAEFVDYASIIYKSFIEEEPGKDIMLDQDVIDEKIDDYDSMLAFGGCHRLGTGAAAHLITHPKLLGDLLISKNIVPFKQNFEAVFQIEAVSSVPLLAKRTITLIDACKIPDNNTYN